jgi:hypothetical protein
MHPTLLGKHLLSGLLGSSCSLFSAYHGYIKERAIVITLARKADMKMRLVAIAPSIFSPSPTPFTGCNSSIEYNVFNS